MRIVIEIEGNQITVSSPDGVVRTAIGASMPDMGEASMPGMPPAGLLERAKKLGAVSAGGAQFGSGAALAAAVDLGEEIDTPPRTARAKESKRRTRRTR
jgi:hypothetical protein